MPVDPRALYFCTDHAFKLDKHHRNIRHAPLLRSAALHGHGPASIPMTVVAAYSFATGILPAVPGLLSYTPTGLCEPRVRALYHHLHHNPSLSVR